MRVTIDDGVYSLVINVKIESMFDNREMAYDMISSSSSSSSSIIVRPLSRITTMGGVHTAQGARWSCV